MVDIDKIKRIKEKSKKKKPRSNITIILLAIIVIGIVGILAMTVPDIVKTLQQKEILEFQELNKAKESAKKTVFNLFKQYNLTDDPELNVFLAKIDSAKSLDEINKIINEAKNYVNMKVEERKNKLLLEQVKNSLINQLKNLYGDYYLKSTLYQEAVTKISMANSIEEAQKIYSEYASKVLDDIKNIIISEIQSSPSNLIYVEPDNKFYYKDIIIKKVSLSNDINYLKNLKVYPAEDLSMIGLVISPTQIPKFPKNGDIVSIYNKNGKLISPAIVVNGYVIVKDITYSESKSVSSSISIGDNAISKSSESNIKYNLDNIPGILHAAVIGRVDYNKISQMFKDYGYRLEKLSENTQILDDENIKYYIILRVPQAKLANITSTNVGNIIISIDSEQ